MTNKNYKEVECLLLNQNPLKSNNFLLNNLKQKTMVYQNQTQQNLAHGLKLSTVLTPFNGGDELPTGGWRGGDELPAGGWRGGDELPAGGWRGGEDIPSGGWRNLIKSDLYLTRDGKGRFEFDFFSSQEGITVSPSSIPKAKGEDEIRPYAISFERPSDKIFSSLAEAKHWAGNWAETIWQYKLGNIRPQEDGYINYTEIPSGGFNGCDELPTGGWRGGDELPAGGWRSFIKSDAYRTEDGRAIFEYEFHKVGNHIEIDIKNTPSYGNRDTNPHVVHQLPSDRGGKKICFGDPSIVTDMAEAKKWAKAYSEATWDYIKTGKPFPNE